MATTDETAVPTWARWTIRATATVSGTVGAVMVATYAEASGQALDVALAVATIVATVVAFARPTRPLPVMVAALLAMLGLALVPPLWLLALVAPVLLWTVRRRASRPPLPTPTDPEDQP